MLFLYAIINNLKIILFQLRNSNIHLFANVKNSHSSLKNSPIIKECAINLQLLEIYNFFEFD